MDDVKNIIDELGIIALENSIKVAGVAVLSDYGEIIYQTTSLSSRFLSIYQAE